LENKSKNVYVTHRIKSECTVKLANLSQVTGKSQAELIEDMINEMHSNYFESNKLKKINENNETNPNPSESVFDQELDEAVQRWKHSNQGLSDFNQRMEDWKTEEKRKNKKQADEFKRKLDDWAKAWQKYFRDYSFSIREDKSFQYKYFNPTDGSEIWKKQMRQYTRQWHPDYAPNDGNPQKFGEMKAEYDILTGKMPTEEYSL